MNRLVIALGSNIDKERNLPLAVRWLRAQCRVTAVSSVYETVPVGLRDQPNFLNAAVLVETELSAAAFKQQVIGALETRLRRQRTPDKNAPRTIDADIVLFNEEVLAYDGGDGRRRRIPEPDLLKFAHVAVPAADLLPALPHPETGEPLAAIAARLLAAAAARQGTEPLWPRPDIRLDVS